MLQQTRIMKATLSGPTVHQRWEELYRTPADNALQEKMFEWLILKSRLTASSKLLDIGCGAGHHAVRLAERGFDVVAADFSPDRVSAAQANVQARGLQRRVSVHEEDLEVGLSFEEQSFDGVLCWGVLMHIPDNERAMSELVRVTRRGGKIMIYENNWFSLYSLLTLVGTAGKACLGRSKVKKIVVGSYGLEYWSETGVGDLLIRQTRLSAMKRFFAGFGCSLKYRTAGHFTELYKFGPPRIRSLFHSFNSIWFSAIGLPYLSCGNLFIFERQT